MQCTALKDALVWWKISTWKIIPPQALDNNRNGRVVEDVTSKLTNNNDLYESLHSEYWRILHLWLPRSTEDHPTVLQCHVSLSCRGHSTQTHTPVSPACTYNSRTHCVTIQPKYSDEDGVVQAAVSSCRNKYSGKINVLNTYYHLWGLWQIINPSPSHSLSPWSSQPIIRLYGT